MRGERVRFFARWRVRAVTAAAVGLCGATRVAGAQVVRGTVVDAAQRAVSGVVVSMLDSTEAVVARALSSDLGEYRLAAPRSGTYRLRALRIGYQPVSTPAMSLTSGTVRSETIVMDGVRVLLDAVRVVARDVCGRQRASANDVIYSAWDQAMTSIAATTLTSSGRGLTATTMNLERVLEPDARRVREQTATVRTDFVRQPWRSMSPDSLRQSGYTRVDAAGTTTYFAPGLEALASPAFLEDHCLRLTEGDDHSEIGVSFEPTSERRAKSEIRGTLWLDRASADLKRLEFEFSDAPKTAVKFAAKAPVAGGAMRFARLDGGAVVITSWEIRMPQLVKDDARAAAARVAGFAVSGGELVALRRGADTLFKRAPVAVRGVLRDSVSGRTLNGATVSLLGTPVSTQSDADGAFTLPDVLPGEYTMAVRTPSLDSVRASSASIIMVTEGMAPLTVRVPTATQLATALCGTSLAGASGHGKGGVVGVVRALNDTIGIARVRVIADWFENTVRGTTVVREGRRMETRADSTGAYRLCGVPTETALSIRAMPDSGRAQMTTVRLAPDQRFATVPLTVDRARTATATLSGTVVVDSTFAPLANAEVAIPALQLSARSNARGEFRLSEIPVGTHEVMVRRVGYGAIVSSLDFRANEAEERRMVLRPMTVLDSVETVATRVDADMMDFEDNKRLGLGHFLTREELDKNIGRKMGDVMSMVPGAGVMRGVSGAWILSKRYVVPLRALPGPTGKNGASMPPDGGLGNPIYQPTVAERNRGIKSGCYAQVYVDGKLQNPGAPTEPFDINQFAPDQLESVEWYAGPSQTPSRYMSLNSPCGVFVLHTRRLDSIKKP